MKYEYKEGREARENFEQAMKAVFKAPKTAKVNRPKKAATSHKNVSDKGEAYAKERGGTPGIDGTFSQQISFEL